MIAFFLNLCWLLSIPHLLPAWGLSSAHNLDHASVFTRSGAASLTVPQPSLTATEDRDSQLAVADFDGDRRPDFATVQILGVSFLRTRYWISFQFSTGTGQALDLTGPSGGLAIFARDVNGDHAPDLVLVTQWLHQPVAVFLNDGAGNFAPADPARFPIHIERSHEEFSAIASQIEDHAVLIAAPLSQPECRGCQRLSPPSLLSGPLSPELFRAVSRQPQSSVSSRAPPTAFLI